MSDEATKPKQRPETLFNQVRSEAKKIRESVERLRVASEALREQGHPAPSLIIDKSAASFDVTLEFLRGVFREF